MHRLFYVSTASPGVTKEMIDTIVSKSISSNIEKNISGALAYNGFNFAQILEGEKDVIFDLYEKIKKDERHTGTILLSDMPIEERAYANWGMSLIAGYEFDELVKAMNY